MLEPLNNIYIEKRQNLESKKENILIFECKKCSENSTEFYNNKCLACFFKGIFLNKNKRFKKIFIESFNINLDTQVTELVLDYCNHIHTIINRYSKIRELWDNCPYRSFGCKIFSDFSSYFYIEEEIFFIPSFLFIEISKIEYDINTKTISDTNCVKCMRSVKKEIESLSILLKKILIIIEFEKFQILKTKTKSKEDFTFFIYLFSKSDSLKNYENTNLKFKAEKENKKLVDSYTIDKNFQAEIYNIVDKTEKMYYTSIIYDSVSTKDYFERIVNNLCEKIPILMFEDTVSLEDLIELYKDHSLRILELRYSLEEDRKEKIAFYCALKIIHLDRIFPLLIDDYLEEIFLDSPNTEIYIDHQKHGRCLTDIRLSSNEIERIITLLRLYSELRLDYSNPSLKYVIKNKYFFCRFAIDVKPVNVNEFSLDIRKLNKNILTIQDLLKYNTLDPLIAAFIYFLVLRNANITVTGKTDVGKTTMINAFDMVTPEQFRKIYVENAIESLEQIPFNRHQLKYQADSLEDTEERHTKSNYIKTLLHRTPDLIYLGEILTKEEAEAMFHCLAAGLTGFQTIHSSSVDSLIHRFIHTFKIDHNQLDDLDVIILMKRDFNGRRKIMSVSEIDINQFHAGEYCKEIFEYNPETEGWKLNKNIYETKVIKKLRKFESLSQEKFENLIFFYKEIFKFLLDSEKISNDKLIDLFNKIAHYSAKSSFTLLQNYWNDWKKNLLLPEK